MRSHDTKTARLAPELGQTQVYSPPAPSYWQNSVAPTGLDLSRISAYSGAMRKGSIFNINVLLAFTGAAIVFGADQRGDSKMPEYLLPRVPPKSPAEALASFEVATGFRIELVAAEPLVVDPVAMAFDEQGRLVCRRDAGLLGAGQRAAWPCAPSYR